MKTTDRDREVWAARDKTPGAQSTTQEKIAFEHMWDDKYEEGQRRDQAT